MMLEEILPDDNHDDASIFISTQIQARLDEIDEEDEKAKQSDLFKKFANNNTDDNTAPEKDTKKRAKTSSGAASRKPTRKKRKILSVTDEMIRKLSGKPQKLKQMGFGIKKSTSTDDDGCLALGGYCDEIEEDYNAVFSGENWEKVRYKILNSGIDRTKIDLRDGEDEEWKNNLWELGNIAPNLDLEDWKLLYSRTHGHIVTHAAEELSNDVPITLSQLFPSSQPIAQADDVLEHGSDTDEVECSSNEGSLIDIPQIHNNRDNPVLISSQDSEGPVLIETREVKFRGSLSLKNNDQIRLTPAQTISRDSTCEIIGSSDDEDDVYIIEIDRPFDDTDIFTSTPNQ